jgi:hypothetical protein
MTEYQNKEKVSLFLFAKSMLQQVALSPLIATGSEQGNGVFVTSMLALCIRDTLALTDWLNRVCATLWSHQTLCCEVL